jgi:sugar fermentation stimulation protein A
LDQEQHLVATESGAVTSAPPQENVSIPLEASLKGTFLRRYKRFFVDIETETGEELTVYCPDPGRMNTTAIAGAPVRCSTSDNPKRKLRHTLEMICEGETWVSVNPLLANAFVEQVFLAQAFPPLAGYGKVKREVSIPDSKSRLDFYLTQHTSDPRPAYVEVKSATLCEHKNGQAVARFPDCVTTRGTRHVQTLCKLVEEGHRAALLFLVQRDDCQVLEPAGDIDPAYAEALREAHQKGVEVFALQARVGEHGIHWMGELAVRL